MTKSSEQTTGRRRWRGALRIEGLFWLARPQSAFSKVPMAAAAWTIGRGELATEPYQAAVLVALLMVLQSVIFVINDIVDAEPDKLSAPFMPIPSGVVRRAEAVALTLALGAGFVAGAALLAGSLPLLLVVLVTIPAALATMKLYGRTKAAWYSPLLASTSAASAPLWAWLLAGYQNVPAFALLFVVASLHGVHANLRAQLRDIEGDPKAGTVTLAVRLGAKRTFWLAVAVRLVELVGVVALALAYGEKAGLLWLLPVFGLLAVGLGTAEKVYEKTRDRVAQTDALSLWMYISFLTEIAIFGVFHPLLALLAAVVMFSWYNLVRRGYYGRLVGGRLARQWQELAELAEPAPRSPELSRSTSQVS